MSAKEQRSGEERRQTEITHDHIFDKLIEHESKIIGLAETTQKNAGLIKKVAADVHIVKEQMTPINDGIRSMVLLFKIAIAVGALSAAFLGIAELWEHFNGV